MATAHAKARLSNQVQEKDARAATDILRVAMFKEVIRTKKTKRRKMELDAATQSESEEEEEESENDNMDEDAEEEEAAPEG